MKFYYLSIPRVSFATLGLPVQRLLWVAAILLFNIGPARCGQGQGELLRNGAFEGGGGNDGKGGGVPDWEPFESGDEVDRREHHGGDQSIRCDSLNPTGKHGAVTHIALNQTHPVPIFISGWSKSDQVSGVGPTDYSLYVDLEYMDGTSLYGQTATFSPGTHDWQHRQLLVVPEKPIKTLALYALFRNHTGTVWFDDFSAHPLEGAGNFDSQALKLPPHGTPAPTQEQVKARDGLGLDLDARGAIEALRADGQAMGAGVGGFYVRDVAADGPLIPIRGAVTRRKAGGFNIGATSNALHIVFNTAVYADGDAIAIDGEVTDMTKTDRAVTVYLTLPVKADGWTWGQDIRHAQTIAADQEYVNQTPVNVGATGSISLYPYGCVASPQGGVGIANQIDWPGVYRIFYNGASRRLAIAWDFALTGKSAAWPSRNARFRCKLFHLPTGPPEWGFRAATQRFYRLNAREFARHARAEGIWIPFTDPSKVEHPEDFGFAYHEGDNSVKTDTDAGILSFRYSEPSTYWMAMPPDMPRTYENALALLQEHAKQTDKGLKEGLATDAVNAKYAQFPSLWAKVVLDCGTQDEAGHFNLEFRDTPWCNGAVFVLNPNPELPATAEKPTKASVVYTVGSAIRRYSDANIKTKGKLSGEYLDSLEAWADTLDYRPSHLQTCPYPIPFGSDTRQPAVPQWYAAHTFVRFLRDDLHNRDRLLMANTAAVRFSIFAPLLDVMGIEVDWMDGQGGWQPDSDAIFNLRRTLSAQKPYLLLMNTNFDRFTSPFVEKYFQRSLFYGVYPSMFSADAANHPYWETPAWYNRDRPLFKKYIPIIKRLSAAGWEPIPYAHTADPLVYVERYGPRLFTLLNDSRQPRDARLTVDLHALKYGAGIPKVVNLFTGAAVPAQVQNSVLTVPVHLDGDNAAALEIR